jgi:hypothetical protein
MKLSPRQEAMLRSLAAVGETEIIDPIFLGPYKVGTKQALVRRGLVEQAGWTVGITVAGRRWLREQAGRGEGT